MDAILLDTAYCDLMGGGGKTFNWELAMPFTNGSKPLILAGGLNINNITRAIKTVNPYIVDVSSGVEVNGKKDPDRIRHFMAEVLSQ